MRTSAPLRLGLGSFVVLLLATPRPAGARATFVINNLDPPGIGFNDPTPAAPIGGNAGTTLGRQRQIAFQYAADVWGKALDSAVPIVVDADFSPLDCSGGLITLGHARAQSVIASVAPNNIIPGLPPNVLFPQPLADRLAGMDLDPGVADIVASFNGGLNDCDPNIDWYYGLDGKAGSLTDLIEVVVHELGHGLGFASGVDLQTGAFTLGIPDTFSSHVFDNSVGLSWLDMSAAQRVVSMKNVRHLVWAGDNVVRLTPSVLQRGAPLVTTVPTLPGFGGNLGETNFGPLASVRTLTGPLVVGNPIDGCSPLPNRAGGIFLLEGGSVCSPLNQADFAASAGAIAVLMTDGNGFAPPSSVELPPDQLAIVPVNIPVVAITLDDGVLLSNNAGRSISISVTGDGSRLTGADAQGRPYLYASDPVRPGSTVSHWDPLARPDLVQEPESGYGHPHDITLETALMHDIGWLSFCGNGRLDGGEECDNGATNSDTAPDACRATCVRAHCGDGVKDTGEACDLGSHNGETTATCTTACAVATPVTPPPGNPRATGTGGGCGCAVVRTTPARGDLALLIAAGAAVLGTRRRRRRSH
jgi:MYXO-CTERM domain-containing protein